MCYAITEIVLPEDNICIVLLQRMLYSTSVFQRNLRLVFVSSCYRIEHSIDLC